MHYYRNFKSKIDEIISGKIIEIEGIDSIERVIKSFNPYIRYGKISEIMTNLNLDKCIKYYLFYEYDEAKGSIIIIADEEEDISKSYSKLEIRLNDLRYVVSEIDNINQIRRN